MVLRHTVLDLILILIHDGIVYHFCRFVTYNHQMVVNVLASNSSPQNYNNTVHCIYRQFFFMYTGEPKKGYIFNYILWFKKILPITLPLYRKFLVTKMLKHKNNKIMLLMSYSSFVQNHSINSIPPVSTIVIDRCL